MSGFKVGDVVVGVGFIETTDREGLEGEVIGPVYISPSHGVPAVFVRWADGLEWGCTCRRLRLKRPPARDDQEPRTDFTPAPPEFVDDLRRMLKQKVTL